MKIQQKARLEFQEHHTIGQSKKVYKIGIFKIITCIREMNENTERQ